MACTNKRWPFAGSVEDMDISDQDKNNVLEWYARKVARRLPDSRFDTQSVTLHITGNTAYSDILEFPYGGRSYEFESREELEDIITDKLDDTDDHTLDAVDGMVAMRSDGWGRS